MLKNKLALLLFFIPIFIIPLEAKEPSKLITEIVHEASTILSSSDPVESKIIKLNNIAEKSVDIDGIGMYTLGKYRNNLSDVGYPVRVSYLQSKRLLAVAMRVWRLMSDGLTVTTNSLNFFWIDTEFP